MKNLILLLTILLISGRAFSQEKEWDIVTGLGLPDCLHIGVNKSMNKKSTLGGSIGYFPDYSNIFQLTDEHQLKLKYSKKFPDMPTWYFAQRLTYMYEDNLDYVWHNIYLTPSMGKHFNFNDRFGLNVDLGVVMVLMEKTYAKLECYDEIIPFLPSLRIQFFYRI